MKFVMFSSGVGFFSNTVDHRNFWVLDSTGSKAVPVSAGFSHLACGVTSLRYISFEGTSGGLGVSSESVYPDWEVRHVHSGLLLMCKDFGPLTGKAFFLPFSKINDFGIFGYVEFCGTSLEEFLHSLSD